MRVLIASILLAAVQVTEARDMFVVVHTQDARVVVYQCEEARSRAIEGLVSTRTVLQQRGGMNWHVVGGVPPYTVIQNEMDGPGTTCVTVIDAVGNVATGCGIVQTFVDIRTVPCPQFNDMVDTARAVLPVVPELDPYKPHVPPPPRRVVDVPPQVKSGSGGMVRVQDQVRSEPRGGSQPRTVNRNYSNTRGPGTNNGGGSTTIYNRGGSLR